jgi:biotin carboxylase
LGGLRYLIPVIEAAHKLGLHVITCDNVPNNIAHKFSDEFHNVSIIDKEAVLKLAQLLRIDGIMSFAVDPGVVTAAYVASKMNLPSAGPYESIKILQNKALFRAFLAENDFYVPTAKGFTSEIISEEELSVFKFPVIVKPVDSAGSKGVTRVDTIGEIKPAIKTALKNSFCGQYIIEEFIEQKGFSSDTDCFSVNGEMKVFSFSNQLFDEKASNPYTPSAYSWPSTISQKNKELLKGELQRLISLLNLGTSVYNVEVREGIDGKAYIMEMAPRGGGNRLSEMIRFSTGADLISNAVKAAVGMKNIDVSQKPIEGYWAEIILHSNKKGKFKKLNIDEDILKNNIVEVDLWVEEGDSINEFNGANDAIGTLVLKFETKEKMEDLLKNQ